MNTPFKYYFLIFICMLSLSISAHQRSATYIANEGVLITQGNTKVLFDPFFHQTFGTYQQVPDKLKKAMFDGTAPFDDITAIVISHAHGDHFSADDLLRYLQRFPSTQLIAPAQAITKLKNLPDSVKVKDQLTSVQLAFNEPPINIEVAGLIIEAVRIPHSGWPSRAEIENIVFRVTLSHDAEPLTVIHMGDADADDDHYLQYPAHWAKRQSDLALPPYWFYLSAEGNDILTDILNAKQSIGIHVPVAVPNSLKRSGKDYFSIPGESRVLIK